ncbi:hypothetical protein BpHYR1_041703 [Brachionus plicatilis]|uniref:Uncharacterized protein n=1 Tax=Brachionus plicatilis TaxID=10195 RepID=A0A3M7Q6T4_BRAPC|nr:hypothetical protein BpHYR1_041703 [Brachionus plicatilis]
MPTQLVSNSETNDSQPVINELTNQSAPTAQEVAQDKIKIRVNGWDFWVLRPAENDKQIRSVQTCSVIGSKIVKHNY